MPALNSPVNTKMGRAGMTGDTPPRDGSSGVTRLIREDRFGNTPSVCGEKAFAWFREWKWGDCRWGLEYARAREGRKTAAHIVRPSQMEAAGKHAGRGWLGGA